MTPRPARKPVRVPNIVETMQDEALFAKWFSEPSWAAWKTFLKTLFALPLDPGEIELFRQCTGREAPPTARCTYATIVCGRRGGKSRILALIAVYLASFFRRHRHNLAPGEIGVVSVTCADKRQAAVVLRYVKGMLNNVPMLKRLVARETAFEIELTTGVSIEIMAGDYRTVRGRTLLAGIVDEAAFLPTSEDSATPDVEIVNALKPGLATVPGSLMLVSSSPYARRGQLWKDYRRLYGQDIADEICWKASTRTMNPNISEAFIQAEIEKDSASASAEYLAEFRSDIESYIGREVIDAAVVSGRFELSPSTAHRYVAGLDPAGGSGQDSMTLAIAFRDGDARVLAAIREWRPRFSPDAVCEEIAALLRSYNLSRCYSDKYSGDWVASRLRGYGVSVDFNEKPASQIYLELLAPLNSGRIQLLDHPRLISQLAALERRNIRASGRELISHPPGGHDDLCNAAAIALVAAEAKPPLKISEEFMQKFRRHTMGERAAAQAEYGTRTVVAIGNRWAPTGWRRS